MIERDDMIYAYCPCDDCTEDELVKCAGCLRRPCYDCKIKPETCAGKICTAYAKWIRNVTDGLCEAQKSERAFSGKIREVSAFYVSLMYEQLRVMDDIKPHGRMYYRDKVDGAVIYTALENTDGNLYSYDFKTKEDAIAWLKGIPTVDICGALRFNPLYKEKKNEGR